MVQNAPLRWWQCSLRSLLILTTLACIASSAFAWRQQFRQWYLERSVAAYNTLMDEQRYAEAEIRAKQASDWYPCPLTEAMVEKAAFARQITFNKSIKGTQSDGGCVIDAAFDETVWQLGDVKCWEELTKKRPASGVPTATVR